MKETVAGHHREKSVTGQNEVEWSRLGAEWGGALRQPTSEPMSLRTYCSHARRWLPTATPVTVLPRASSGVSACPQDRQEVLGVDAPRVRA